MIRKPSSRNPSFERVRVSGDGRTHIVGTVPSRAPKRAGKKLAAWAAVLGVTVGFLRSSKGQQFLREQFKFKVGDRQVFPPVANGKKVQIAKTGGVRKSKAPNLKRAVEKSNLKFWDTEAKSEFKRPLTASEKNSLNSIAEKMEGDFPNTVQTHSEWGLPISGGTKEQRLLNFIKEYKDASPQEIRKALATATQNLKQGNYNVESGGKQRMQNRQKILIFLCTPGGRIILEKLK